MIGYGTARELARLREEEIARQAARPPVRPSPSAELLPGVTVLAGVILAVALGAPVTP